MNDSKIQKITVFVFPPKQLIISKNYSRMLNKGGVYPLLRTKTVAKT